MKVAEVIREVKDITSFIAQQSPMVTVPADGARAKIFTSADRQAIERFVPSTRGMTDAETLEAGKAFLETLLNRIKSGEQLTRMDQRIVAGLYDIIRRQTDRYDTFMRKHGLDETVLAELTFKGSTCTVDCSGHQAGYEWYQRKQRTPNSASDSFNKGAALSAAGL